MKDDWISATEIASYAYCPEAWRLEHGLNLESANQSARARGEVVHERWQRTERRSAWWLGAAVLCLVVSLLLWMFT